MRDGEREPDEIDDETGRYTDARGANEGAYPETAADREEQPESQGDAPLIADLGEEGQGDLAPEDL